jgi:hypothetical protein
MIRPIMALITTMACCSPAAGAEVEACVPPESAKGTCHAIRGELQFWQGWPPHLRIETSDKKLVFGLNYSDEKSLPAPLQALVNSGVNKIKGAFVVCLLGGKTSVPYDKRSIEFACLKSMDVPRQE